jgi:DNA-binding transcriptional LysR family regulator
MNLEYLKTYIEVVRLGSFSEVAKRLGLSQPAVSFQIQKLERDLGVRLIDRSQRQVTMTEAGKRLLDFARSIEGEWEQLKSDIDRLREEVTGELAVAASTIPGEFLLPRTLGEFRALHPGVTARMAISDSLTVIGGVSEGAYDVGFCGVAPESGDLESVVVASDELVLIVFPEHPFAARGDILVADLEGEPLIFREETSGTQASLKVMLMGAGLNLKKWVPSLTLGTPQAVISAVEAGAGIAFVSNLAAEKSLALGLVRQVTVRNLSLRRDFFCVYRRERIVSRLLEEFISFVRAKAASK